MMAMPKSKPQIRMKVLGSGTGVAWVGTMMSAKSVPAVSVFPMDGSRETEISPEIDVTVPPPTEGSSWKAVVSNVAVNRADENAWVSGNCKGVGL